MFEYHPRSNNAQSYEMGPMVWKRMEIAIIESERKKSQLTLTVRAWSLSGEMIYKAVIIWQYSVITAGIQLDQVVTKKLLRLLLNLNNLSILWQQQLHQDDSSLWWDCFQGIYLEAIKHKMKYE